MSLFREIWRILSPRQRWYVLAAQLVSLLMAFSTVIGIAAIAPFFAVLGEPRLIDRNAILHWWYAHGGFTDRHEFVVALGLAFIAVVLIANLINVAGSMVMNRLALWIGNELQTTLFAYYLDRPYLFHTRTSSATLFNNIIYETARLTNGILQNAFTLVTNIITAACIVLAILLLNPAVSIAMIAFLAGGYVLIYLAVRDRLLRFGEAQSISATEQARIVNESFGAIREIILLRTRDFFRGSFERASRSVSLATAHSHVVGQSPKHIMECVAVGGLVGLALLLGGRNDGGGPWLGQLTLVAFAAYRLLPTLQQVFVAIVKIRAEHAAFASVAPDLRHARAAAPPVYTHVDSAWRDRPTRDIRLRNVSFRYSDDRAWALDGVSLCIPARSAVGFVGANGAGKTTLVDLIAGLLSAASGQLEVDGTVLDHSNRSAWQARIAYVPQSIFLFDSSIAQNIALGVPPVAIDRQRLQEAVRLAQLDEVIRRLPGGFDHPVGERGVELSGGQRQRIGIARALYKDASVLLLDEATNALDGLTEQELMATLGRLRGRYTIILIAHRLSTVRMCDSIFELADGKIVASGTYEELLKHSEAFRRMAGVH
jgi:ATP-binding cassette, subfamily B, bacterial PglK